MYKRLIVLLFTFLLLFISCNREQSVHDKVKLYKNSVTEQNYTTIGLDEFYYYLLYKIQFKEDFNLVGNKTDFFEEKAKLLGDSSNIYKANILQIYLNPDLSYDNDRYKTLFQSNTYFENHNDYYHTYFSSYLIAEYYYYLQYFKLAENFAYKALNQVNYKSSTYAYEKAQTYILISNIHYNQKEYNAAFNILSKYEELATEFETNLVSKEKINQLKSSFINNYAIMGTKTGKVSDKEALSKLNEALKLATAKDAYQNDINKTNTLHNVLYYKIKTNDVDSLDYLFAKVNENKEHLMTIPIFQLNYALIADYYLKIKKDTLASKKFQKELLIENDLNLHNDYLEKRILEQIINDTDSHSIALNKHYLATASKLQVANTSRQKFSQKVVNETHTLLNYNYKFEQEVWIIVLIIVGVGVGLFFIFLNIFQKIKYKKIKIRNKFLDQDQKALHITLDYKTYTEKKLEENKKQIFMELHDGIVNQIFSTRFLLHKDFYKTENKKIVKETLSAIKESLISISNNYENLNEMFKDESFEKLLNNLIDSQPTTHIKFKRFHTNYIDWKAVDTHIKFNLFRILQELIQNIHKHSNANLATFYFTKIEEGIEVQVHDNGIGFKIDDLSGIGMQNIKDRIQQINASFEIENNSGTKITLKIQL